MTDTATTDAASTPKLELSGEQFEFLRIYIRDHDGASSGGIRLAERCYESNRTTSLGPRLGSLVETLRTAQNEVRVIAERLAIKPSALRQATTWLGATVGGLKLNGRWTSYSPLSRVVEIEALTSAVSAQLRLWETLQRLVPFEHRFDAASIEGFLARCHELLDDLSAMHDVAADEAFTPSQDPQLATAHLTGTAQAENADNEPPA